MAAQEIVVVQADSREDVVDNQGEGYSRKSKRKRDVAEVVDARESVTKARKKKYKGVQGSGVVEGADMKMRKKKDKSRLRTEQGLSNPLALNEEGDGEPEEGERKKPLSVNDLVPSKEMESSRKTSASETSSAASTEEIAQSKRTKRKDKSKHAGVETVDATKGTPAGTEGTEKPRKKKRKHKEEGVVDAGASELAEPHKKKTRSSQKNAEFPDPSEDTILSESARKVLQYIHSRVSSHPDWKFNKARQNWLVRNVWDDAAVPETYFASCLKYLAGVQGNTRDLLIKSSTTFVNPAPSDPEPNTTSTDDPLVTATGITTAGSSEDLERRRKLKADRARAMLVALGVDVKSSN